jgi:hypothetical protein
MWLPTKLRSALESLETAQNLQAEVQGLREKIEALEALQLDREVQWTETKDQVLRHLKRVQAVRQHLEGDAPAEDPTRPSIAQVIAAKYKKGA